MSDLNETAPDGQIFMCSACGKTNKRRVDVGDESCWMHSVLVYEDSIVRNASGQAVTAKAVQR